MKLTIRFFLRCLVLALILSCVHWGVPHFPTAWAATAPCPSGMTYIKGGTFTMGSNQFYPEEKASGKVQVSDFCMAKTEVTNAEFAEFVAATRYVTVAEQPLSTAEFPDLPLDARQPGSVVFIPHSPGSPVVPEMSWWHWVNGADWQHPNGPESTIIGKTHDPVVQIAFADAQAYATWKNASLPTEAQWEYAAKGGKPNWLYTWGNQYAADRANTWQGRFPYDNTQADGYLGLAPVRSFPPNSYGLYDMTGNVWEWTDDWYKPGHEDKTGQQNPVVADASASFDPRDPKTAKHVIKGGSYLCARNYCSRYRPTAREGQEPNSGTSHIGFRLVKKLEFQ